MSRLRNTNLLALLGFVALSFAYFGWPLLPHPGRVMVGPSQDPQIFIWSFAWWPHAIGHWIGPFVSHAIYSPSGINLAWVVSVPGLALAFSPLTVIFGPVVSYNVAMLLMPAISAWTAYLLCRYLTRSVWASLIGGYLYGFSGSILREQLWGNLHATALFLLPLFALVIVRYLRGDSSARGLAWRLGLLLGFQLWVSTEFAFSFTLILALGLVLAFWLVRDLRPRLLSSLRPIVAGYALAALLAAPLLVYALLGFVSTSFIPLNDSGSDLLNFVIPTRAMALGGSSFTSLTSHFQDGGVGAYLGLPMLAIFATFAWRAYRSGSGRFLIAALVVTSLIALGPDLWVDGRRVIPLPWDALVHLPGFSNAFAFRFSGYLSLSAAVIVALWTATTKGWIFKRPYLLPALAVVSLIPAFWQPFFHLRAQHLTFFTDGLYKTCIPPNETVAIFPFGFSGNSLLWQAETGFRFQLAGDGLAPFPEQGKALNSFDSERIVWEFTYDPNVGLPTMDRVLAFAATHHVGRILSDPSGGYPSRAQMQRFGPTQLVGGMLVSPACGQPPLTQRDLTKYVQEDSHEAMGSAPSIGYCSGSQFSELAQGLDPVGALKGAQRAIYVAGQGLTCAAPPAGYKRHGFATPAMSVPADTYALYEKGS